MSAIIKLVFILGLSHQLFTAASPTPDERLHNFLTEAMQSYGSWLAENGKDSINLDTFRLRGLSKNMKFKGRAYNQTLSGLSSIDNSLTKISSSIIAGDIDIKYQTFSNLSLNGYYEMDITSGKKIGKFQLAPQSNAFHSIHANIYGFRIEENYIVYDGMDFSACFKNMTVNFFEKDDNSELNGYVGDIYVRKFDRWFTAPNTGFIEVELDTFEEYLNDLFSSTTYSEIIQKTDNGPSSVWESIYFLDGESYEIGWVVGVAFGCVAILTVGMGIFYAKRTGLFVVNPAK